MSAAGQGADFDDLYRAMRPPLKANPDDPGMYRTTRRLLRELAADGYIAEEDGRWRMVDREMIDVFAYLALTLYHD